MFNYTNDGHMSKPLVVSRYKAPTY